MESAYYRKVQPKVGGWMKKTAKNKNLLIALLFIVPIASFITFSNKGILQRMTMESRKVEMEARVKKAEIEQRKLQGQTKALDNDPRAIEKVARERYGMTREGETVYKVKKRSDPGIEPPRRTMDLFQQDRPGLKGGRGPVPLAERLRPAALPDVVGQQHLLGEGKPLRTLIERDEVPSMIFWGPPGCGKTTIARIIAVHTKAEFFQLNAVAAGVQDVRKVLERAGVNRDKLGKRTILFIDEIHRFNKAQQDALLHSVEDGVITLIGATTENPSFEVIGPLLSRCMVYVLEPLGVPDLERLIDHALAGDEQLKQQGASIGKEEREFLMMIAGGDARIMLNGLETALRLVKPDAAGKRMLTRRAIEEAFQRRHVPYDKGGEEHYNVISAFIKSIRGSDPDAAVYWLARMLEGGEDPKFIARRMVILASEDVGNADPGALPLAVSCFTAVDYVGMPEGRIVLAQAATYLASAPKSNASYMAVEEALGDVRRTGGDQVPLHLRNAPTKLMKELHYGEEYKYSHSYDEHFTEQQYLPDSLKDKIYYRPTDIGAEKAIHDRLNKLWKHRQR